MNSALEFERNETASLDRFLAWFSRGNGRRPARSRTARQRSAGDDRAWRQGARGAGGDPRRCDGRSGAARPHADHSRFRVEAAGGRRCSVQRRMSAARHSTKSSSQQERRDLEEHWRLLYVALTRAADRLIVSGVAPRRRRTGRTRDRANCWHRVVEQAMGRDRRRAGRRTGAALWLGRRGTPRKAKGRSKLAARRRCRTGRAAGAAGGASAASAGAVGDCGRRRSRAAAERKDARRRPAGNLIHQLLERLAGGCAGRPRGARERWLERSAGIADAAARDEIVDQVCGILSDPRFAPLFGRDRSAKRRSPRPCPTAA